MHYWENEQRYLFRNRGFTAVSFRGHDGALT